MKKVLCVVQARMGSSRLPGKVVADLLGRPMLAFMLERLTRSPVDGLVVATSQLSQDDVVVDIAARVGIDVVRGPEVDVLGRFLLALEAHPANVVVRLTADCPLIDYALVTAAVEVHESARAAYTSNSLVRTYPDGLDVEVVDAAALREAADEAADPVEREHVTPFVYRRPARYRLAALRTPELLGHERWTVDDQEDLERVRSIAEQLDDPLGASWLEVLAVAGRTPLPPLYLRPATDSDGLIVEQMESVPYTEPIGDGRPVRPLDKGLDDPSIRSWVVVHDTRPAGWLQVAVDNGTGALTGRASSPSAAEALVLLRRTLAADLQVRRLALIGRG